MKLIDNIINSNIFIALAAVFLTLATQVQLGLEVHFHNYLYLIFFATLLEYNFHKLVVIWKKDEEYENPKYDWVKANLKFFYILIFVSLGTFLFFVLTSKIEVVIAFMILGFITFFYSQPFLNLFNIRSIPYTKLFIISVIWSLTTIILPLIYSHNHINENVILIIIERIFFLIAITIPFDIRDIEQDKTAKIKTLPILLGKEKAYKLSYISLLIFIIICIIHYANSEQLYILIAMILSGLSSFIFLYSDKIRRIKFYHYGILDGTMLLQGLLILGLGFLK